MAEQPSSFLAWNEPSFQHNYFEYYQGARGKTFNELGKNRAESYREIDCCKCLDFKCKNRRHEYGKPLSFFTDTFFTCSQLRLRHLTAEEKEAREKQAAIEVEKAKSQAHIDAERLHKEIDEWLNKQDPEKALEWLTGER